MSRLKASPEHSFNVDDNRNLEGRFAHCISAFSRMALSLIKGSEICSARISRTTWLTWPSDQNFLAAYREVIPEYLLSALSITQPT